MPKWKGYVRRALNEIQGYLNLLLLENITPHVFFYLPISLTGRADDSAQSGDNTVCTRTLCATVNNETIKTIAQILKSLAFIATLSYTEGTVFQISDVIT
jgi:hypothetical protein